jgi:hypothetical protein
MAKGDVKVAIIGDASSLVGALSKSSAAGSAMQGVFAGVGMAVGTSMMGMAKSVANFAGDSIQKFMDLGTQTRTLMRETGMTAEAASTLGVVFKASSVDIDSATKALKIFDKNLVAGKLDNYAGGMKDAAEASDDLKDAQMKLSDAQEHVNDLQIEQSQKSKKTYRDTVAMREALEDVTKAQTELGTAQNAGSVSLDKYGIKVRDAEGKLLPMWDILTSTADTFEKLGDGPEAAALAMKLFGKDGMSMLPFLQQGKDGLDKLSQSAQASGLVLGGDAMQKWKDARQASRELSIQWEGMQVTVGQFLLPALTSVSKWFTEEQPTIKEAGTNIAKSFHDLFGEDSGASLRAGGEQVGGMFDKLEEKWTTSIGTVDDLRQGFNTLGDGMIWVKDNVLDPIWGSLQWAQEHVLQPLWDIIQNIGTAIKDGLGLVVGLFTGDSGGAGKHAGGGFLSDGMNMVGENGPELVYTRGGKTSVSPSTQSGGGVGGTPTILQDTYVINIDGNRLAVAERRRELGLA